ncbi:MAG: SDR family oxidoreductase [Proteobacteria bacterium]|nr:SDR family oxidoreductase [Pseudomonadota bacterium]
MGSEVERREDADELVSGRWLQPEEIADTIVFLCSDEARGVHGAILNVNGGNLMP